MITRSAISVLILLVLAGPRVSAQVLYGSLSGTVADSTGAVVPGAARHRHQRRHRPVPQCLDQ